MHLTSIYAERGQLEEARRHLSGLNGLRKQLRGDALLAMASQAEATSYLLG